MAEEKDKEKDKVKDRDVETTDVGVPGTSEPETPPEEGSVAPTPPPEEEPPATPPTTEQPEPGGTVGEPWNP